MGDNMSDAMWEVNENAMEQTISEIDAHYTKLAIQPMQYSMDNKLDPMQHTIIKYVTRFRDKGGLRDLLAARRTMIC